jgi:hypothetical protein
MAIVRRTLLIVATTSYTHNGIMGSPLVEEAGATAPESFGAGIDCLPASR